MASAIAELFVSVSADVSEALVGLNALSGALDNTKAGFEAAAPAAEALVGIGAGIATGLAAATIAAADFSNRIIEVRNNTTQTDADMAAMNATILQLGAEAPVSLENLATGFMHVSNFGFDAADATTILETAMKSAVSTGGNTADTAEVLAAILHEFGLNASDAARTMDQLHLAAAEGNLTLEQFSSSFGQVAAFAAAVGVPLDQAAAAMSAMTRHGFDAATAATQVKDAIVHIINPSQEAQKTIADLSSRSGIDLTNAFSATGLHANGLTGTLSLVTAAMNKLGLTQDQQTALWLKLIPNIRGGAASFVLAGRGADDFSSILKDLDGSISVTDEAFDRIQKQAAFQWGTLGNQFRELGINIGGFLLPRLVTVGSALSALIKQFISLPEQVKSGIVNVAAFGGAISLLIGGFVLLAPFLAALPAAFAVLTGALVALAPAFAIAAALFLALKIAWENDFLGIQEIAANFSNIGDIIQAALAGDVGPAFEGLVEDFARISPQMRDFITLIRSTVIPAIGELAQFIVSNFGPAANYLATTVLPTLIQAGIDLISLYLQPAKLAFEALTSQPATEFFNNLAQAIGQFTSEAAAGFIDFFQNTLPAVLAAFGQQIQSLSPLFDSLGNFFRSLLDVVVALGTVGFTALQGLFQNVLVPGFTALGDALGPTVVAAFQGVRDALLPMGDALEQIGNHVQPLAQFFNNAAAALEDFANKVEAARAKLPGFLQPSSPIIGGGANSPNGATVSHAAFIPGGGGAGAQSAAAIVNFNAPVSINGAGDLNDFVETIAAAIRASASRVSPPVPAGQPGVVSGFI